TVDGLAKNSGDERFAYDSYRRFLQMYGQVVLGIEHHHFEELIENHKIEVRAVLDTELGAEDWHALAASFKEVVQSETGKPFPQDAHEQLWGAIAAVFGSWNNTRAGTYRLLHNTPAEWGPPVNAHARVFGKLLKVRRNRENKYRDMQNIEFTVERGKLWMLQTRTGKRTAQAALKIAVSFVEEGVIGRDEAIRRIEPNSLDQLLHPMLDPSAKTTVLAHGLPASPGAASGKIVFSADEAESAASRGESVILVRIET